MRCQISRLRSILLWGWFLGTLGCQWRASHENPEERSIDSSPVFIYAASSMERFVAEVTTLYHKRDPQRAVHLELTGSHTARLQLERGAPAGVLISATPHHVDTLEDRGLIARRQTLARNRLVWMARQQLKLHQRISSEMALDPLISLLESHHPPLRWGLGDARVPIGELAQSILRDRGLLSFAQRHTLTYALSARALRNQAQRREVDLAILYESDARSLKDWRPLPLPSSLTDRYQAHYVIALTRSSQEVAPSSGAQLWWSLAVDSQRKSSLTRLGFN